MALSIVLIAGLVLTSILLIGAPVEDLLSLRENPVTRIVMVAFAVSVVTLVGLSIVLYQELAQHRATVEEMQELRSLVLAALENNEAMAAANDRLEARLDEDVELLREEMATGRQRIRSQVRAWLRSQGHAPSNDPDDEGEEEGSAQSPDEPGPSGEVLAP